MTKPPETPGASIRTLRTMAGLTLDEVAKQAHVSASHLSRVETGQKRAHPQWIGAVVTAIAGHLAAQPPTIGGRVRRPTPTHTNQRL